MTSYFKLHTSYPVLFLKPSLQIIYVIKAYIISNNYIKMCMDVSKVLFKLIVLHTLSETEKTDYLIKREKRK